MADMPIRLYRLDVSKGAKLVLSYLWRYAGRDRFVWVDRETIAGDLGIESERTLRRHLGELKGAGAIAEDVQVRAGRTRPGWWLHDEGDVGRESDVGGVSADPEPETTEATDEPSDEPEGPSGDHAPTHAEGSEAAEARGQNWPPPDKTDRPRPKLAAAPAKNGRPRTKMAADPANFGRPIPIELPGTNSLSPSISVEATSRASPIAVEQDRVRAGWERLRRWRVHGDDPEGLGPWPSPTTPSGLALPRLSMGGKLVELLEQDRAPEDLHRAVHLVAELVEAGQLPADKWRATYVFSGWHEELVVKALELRAKQAWAEERRRETGASEPANESTAALEISRAAMLRTMGESITLRAVADVLQEPPPEPRSPRQATAPDDYLERLDVRSHVQAMAEQLGREPGDVLRALGRGSMRELEVSDRQRLAQVFAELSSGP